MNQDANDSKGSNNGTWNGSGGGDHTSAAWQTSGSMFGPGMCLDFDGSQDYVDFGTSLSVSGDITVSAWIYSRLRSLDVLPMNRSAGRVKSSFS